MTRLVLLMVCAALVACSEGDAKQKKGDAKAAPPVPVTVIEVAPREVPVVFEAVGRTEGSREVQVRARVAGILEKQLYTEGDRVKAGATLFQIERAPFEIDLQQNKAALAQEKASARPTKRHPHSSKASPRCSSPRRACASRRSTSRTRRSRRPSAASPGALSNRSAAWSRRTTTRQC